jgi:hypothetical protein
MDGMFWWMGLGFLLEHGAGEGNHVSGNQSHVSVVAMPRFALHGTHDVALHLCVFCLEQSKTVHFRCIEPFLLSSHS